MVRHTLGTLGPKVLAGRMVRDYVEQLYAPAARSHRAVHGEAAAELAGWKRRVRQGWPQVGVDHVETDFAQDAAQDAPGLGATLTLRAQVALGGLDPSDVDVQLLSGRVDAADRLTAPAARAAQTGGPPRRRGPLTRSRAR